MKRKVISLLLCLLIISTALLSVSAASYLPMVIDSAELLSGQERIALEDKAQALRNQYEMDVVILTVDDLEGKTAQQYADDYYDEHGYGYGEDYSGILFLIAMDSREWYMSTCGDAIYIFTDYGLDQLGETIVPYLSSGDYYDAFDLWLDQVSVYYEEYQHGTPIDGYVQPDIYYPEYGDEVVYYEREHSPSFLVSLIIGAVVATVTILIMRSRMNTAKPQKHAVGYMKEDTYHLHTCRDLFLYSRVSRTAKPKNTGGGSSVHRSSGGRSHGGRGGRF